MKRLFFLLVPIILITFIGCGSGGGNSSSSTPTTTVALPSGETITWNAPSLNEDGITAFDDFAKYKIYYGSDPSNNVYPITIDDLLTTSYDTSPITPGSYCFVVVAVDSAGNESMYSDELCITLS